MRIAIIGWGSLVWDPRNLARTGGWRTDGPRLPVEFSRISADGRLTLVIHLTSDLQQTYWALSSLDNLEAARENLRARECTGRTSIHWATRTDAHDPVSPIVATTQRWLRERTVDAAIWTGLAPTIDGDVVANAVAYLSGIGEDDERWRRVREYVVKAPPQIQTRVRRTMQVSGWTDEPLPDDIFEGYE
jgi:hypothetical protein